MLIVPLQAVPSQSLNVLLNGQNCQLEVYQKPSGLFMNVQVNNSDIVTGVLCENLNRIVRSLYLGFSGDFCFFDSQGTTDPIFSGLGGRYSLAYLAANELPPGQG